MPRDNTNRQDYSPDSLSEGSRQVPGLLETARSLEQELRGVVHDHLELAALETRQAGESLVRIVVMGVLTACLLFSAWLALVGAGVIMLVQYSPLGAGGAMMVVFAIHSVLAVVLIAAIRRHSRNLLFPATIDRLTPGMTNVSRIEGSR